jgi:hypothetical protein
MKVKTILFLSSSVVTMSVLALGPTTVFAAAGQNDGVGGINVSSSQIRGVSATIHTPTVPYVSSSEPQAGSSSWVMDHNSGSTSNESYAQVGFYDLSGEGVYYFFEEVDSSGNGVDILTNGNETVPSSTSNHYFGGAVGPAVNSNHVYQVEENSGDDWVGTVDGAFGNTFDVYDGSWIGNEEEFIDEVHDYVNADFYGTPSDPVKFSDWQWMDGSYNWHYAYLDNAPSHTGYGGVSSFNNQESSSSYFQTWDTRS